jgi:arabinogalactan endo-1,4-beta-galactosidase
MMNKKSLLRSMGYVLLALLIAGLEMPAAFAGDAVVKDQFVKGVDLSILKAAMDSGVRYKVDGRTNDPLTIFKDNGCRTGKHPGWSGHGCLLLGAGVDPGPPMERA